MTYEFVKFMPHAINMIRNISLEPGPSVDTRISRYTDIAFQVSSPVISAASRCPSPGSHHRATWKPEGFHNAPREGDAP